MVVSDSVFFCHFVHPDLRVDKEGTTEYGVINFEVGVEAPATD